tara:strand:+ start:794 stop:1381 length:588 start_codon:yes stop_codon:yes gene_type:complete
MLTNTIDLFPTTIFESYKKFDTDILMAAINSNMNNKNEQCTLTYPDLHYNDTLKPIQNYILDISAKASEAWGYEEQPMTIKGMWGVKSTKHGGLKQHGHPGNWLCGCYYLEVHESDHILFHDPRARALAVQPLVKDWNDFNRPIAKLKAKKNHFYIFPSWLEHSTEAVKHNKERVSISWNIKLPNKLSSGYEDYG